MKLKLARFRQNWANIDQIGQQFTKLAQKDETQIGQIFTKLTKNRLNWPKNMEPKFVRPCKSYLKNTFFVAI